MAVDREELAQELASQSVDWLRRKYLAADPAVPEVPAGPPGALPEVLPEVLPEGLIEALAKDPRRGAQQLAAQLLARRAARQAEDERLSHLTAFENDLRQQGFQLIAGVDEAGVGPMAGPVVAAAVMLPQSIRLEGLDDSKRLTEARRAELAAQIKAHALAWAVGLATVEEIDQINIYQASLQAMRRAVDSLSIRPEQLLVDARTLPDCPIPQQGIVRGDARSASIAAASIIAKTTRDAILTDLDRLYPGYGLAIHKGYATAAHLEAMKQLGVLPIHRRSFRPVRIALGIEPAAPEQRDLF
ncbi:MAG: ribonuclease HII [Acidobacteriota bacterium]